ncbi:MAG: hypothetical protein HY898_35935 [Deltaproteobacteria bacterium]|nr:hypothetical protein [Deltaproteobacteria bacterium]
MRVTGAFCTFGLTAGVLLSAAIASAQGWPPPQTQPAQPPATATQPKPATGGFEAGGLAPPTPIGNDPNAPGNRNSPTETRLRKSESDDSGRGLEWFYVNAEGGLQVLGLQTFSSSGLAYGPVKTTAVGPMFGGGLGLRLMFFTFGARARMGMFDQYKLGTINGEFGFHIPLGDLEPYFTLGAGYAVLTSLNANADWGTSSVSVRGYDIRAGAGLDYYITPVFSIGANLTGEMLGLSRPSGTLSPTPSKLNAADQKTAQTSGSSVGSALTISAVAGLHF